VQHTVARVFAEGIGHGRDIEYVGLPRVLGPASAT
jgi:hypothetical protein